VDEEAVHLFTPEDVTADGARLCAS
jgi:hypothetical protein